MSSLSLSPTLTFAFAARSDPVPNLCQKRCYWLTCFYFCSVSRGEMAPKPFSTTLMWTLFLPVTRVMTSKAAPLPDHQTGPRFPQCLLLDHRSIFTVYSALLVHLPVTSSWGHLNLLTCIIQQNVLLNWINKINIITSCHLCSFVVLFSKWCNKGLIL